MQTQVTPLTMVYRSLLGPDPVSPKRNFIIGVKYPNLNVSAVRQEDFQVAVEWDGKKKILTGFVVIENIVVHQWPTMEEFFVTLNKEIKPYLAIEKGGALGAARIPSHPNLMAPSFKFQMLCEKVPEETLCSVFERVLCDRAAHALWLCRSIFEYLISEEKEPSVEERSRMLLREHGFFTINRQDGEMSSPQGFFQNCYEPNASRLN